MDWITIVTAALGAVLGIFLGWRSGKKAYAKKQDEAITANKPKEQ